MFNSIKMVWLVIYFICVSLCVSNA